jgi:hypothetical protein
LSASCPATSLRSSAPSCRPCWRVQRSHPPDAAASRQRSTWPRKRRRGQRLHSAPRSIRNIRRTNSRPSAFTTPSCGCSG